MMDDQVQIALSADQKYFEGLLTTAVSIADSAASDVELVFNVLDGGIDEPSWTLLRNAVARTGRKTVVNRYPVVEKIPEGLRNQGGLGVMAYARLLLPFLLPESCHHVIYCDVDFLWRRDIGELWRQRDDAVVAQSSPDGYWYVGKAEGDWFKKEDIPFDFRRYFCSGLLFMNLRRFREEDLSSRLFEFIRTHPDVPFYDQTALNVFLARRSDFRMVDRKWQTTTGTMSKAEKKSENVIHFGGDAPWKMISWHYMLSDMDIAWFRVNARAHGIGVWQAMRRFYPAWLLVMTRLVYLFVCRTGTIGKGLFYAAARMAGKEPENIRMVLDRTNK